MSDSIDLYKEQNTSGVISECDAINHDNCVQYQECNLENVKILLAELFQQEITNDNNLQKLCADDVTKLDVIKNNVNERFGVIVTIEDIVNSSSVEKFTEILIQILNSPKCPVSERYLRRNQLSKIAEENSLDEFINKFKLTKTDEELEKSRNIIKGIKAPIKLVGHQTDSEFLNEILDKVDSKVSRNELKRVVLEMDKNTFHSVRALGDAIECTNTWIDSICKMLIWIIQVEDDIYGLTEESSRETLRISELLSQEGVNIKGLTKIAALEQSKRQDMQLRVREFKSDINGKIEFLNNVHKDLLNKFEEQRTDINKVLESMKTEQSRFFESVKSEYEREFKKIDEEISSFKKEQSNAMEKAKKRANIYKVISCVACAVSIVALVLTII